MISLSDNPEDISIAFDRRNGKCSFELDFMKTPDSIDSHGHVAVSGSIYSGEFRNNDVGIEFRLSPKYDLSIDT